jgi:ABC-2 type transport system ATP-binding protein
MIKIEGFSHRYGELEAVKNLQMEVETRDIYGFIGPNGAGKTTTIRFLATLLRPEKGQAWIHKINVLENAQKIRRIIGFMPDHFGVYQGMTVEEFLDFFGLAYSIPRQQRRKVIADILSLLDLESKRKSQVTHLSKGMRQRLGLARTLLHDPPVLILDEPASGLDPRARIEVMELLKELQSMGKTILVSSHILSELATYCNRIGIIEQGQMVAQGSLQDIVDKLQTAQRLSITVLDKTELACQYLQQFPNVFEVESHENEIHFRFRGELSQISSMISALAAQNIPLLWVKEIPMSLEEVFMLLTKGKVQ